MKSLKFSASLVTMEALAFSAPMQGSFRNFQPTHRSACRPHPFAFIGGRHPHDSRTRTSRKGRRHRILFAGASRNSDAGIAALDQIDVAGLTTSQVAELVDFSRPCILTGLLSSPECEAWCDAMLEDLGEETCAFQIRCNESGRSEVFESTLMDFVQGLQDESSHDESWYLLEEHLLELPNARPGLGDLLAKAQGLLGDDEFELFPAPVRPQNLCAIVGGVGARSFLHSDPMEWMGWNVLLEGRKLWTFLPPLSDLDVSLGTYRLAPNAFGSHNVSAGWQSNVDLYRRGPTTTERTEATTTAGEVVDGTGSLRACWPTEGEGREVMKHAISGVQEVGDVVLIPPRHWHQVYHLEPSVAVASQYMDYRVRDRVFRHILDWCGAGHDVLLSQRFDELEPSAQIEEVLRAALVARHGQQLGLETFASLYDDP
ncbi:unnamed protein product [Scytosiphon promiscuus]